MTKDEKVEAYRMRLDGASFAEIGNRFGVSRQYIQQILPRPRKNRIEMSAESCIYNGISKWMLENGVSYAKLARCVGLSNSCLSLVLAGKVAPTKTTIDKILEFTQMSYEEAFSKKEEGK